jgi:hypothetical protein
LSGSPEVTWPENLKGLSARDNKEEQLSKAKSVARSPRDGNRVEVNFLPYLAEFGPKINFLKES